MTASLASPMPARSLQLPTEGGTYEVSGGRLRLIQQTVMPGPGATAEPVEQLSEPTPEAPDATVNPQPADIGKE